MKTLDFDQMSQIEGGNPYGGAHNSRYCQTLFRALKYVGPYNPLLGLFILALASPCFGGGTDSTAP